MFVVESDGDVAVEYYGAYTYVADDKRGIKLLVMADGYDDTALATAIADALNAVPIAIEKKPVAEPPALSPGRLLAAKQAVERHERLAAILRYNTDSTRTLVNLPPSTLYDIRTIIRQGVNNDVC